MPAIIVDAARKHGVDDADIWNCYRLAYDERWDEDSGLWFAYGFDTTGRPLAVAFFTRDDAVDVIIHALRGEIPAEVMKTRSQEEIEELIASGEVDRMVERARQAGRPGLTIKGPALVAFARVARRHQSTDDEFDAAIAVARAAGHTWAEIEPILHAFRGEPASSTAGGTTAEG